MSHCTRDSSVDGERRRTTARALSRNLLSLQENDSQASQVPDSFPVISHRIAASTAPLSRNKAIRAGDREASLHDKFQLAQSGKRLIFRSKWTRRTGIRHDLSVRFWEAIG